uniref:Uncharacterized protein n=1 Tax=Rhabditophanes sp. KR3021 TaxID=114890 RepID=A0AC35TKP8_9BILA
MFLKFIVLLLIEFVVSNELIKTKQFQQDPNFMNNLNQIPQIPVLAGNFQDPNFMNNLKQIPKIPSLDEMAQMQQQITLNAQATATASASATSAPNKTLVVNAGLNFTPPHGFFKLSFFGVSYGEDGRFFFVYVNINGTPLSFDDFGQKRRVFFDSDGVPVGFKDNKVFTGFAIINNIPNPSSNSGPYWLGRYETTILTTISLTAFPKVIKTTQLIIGMHFPDDDVFSCRHHSHEISGSGSDESRNSKRKCKHKKCKKGFSFDDSDGSGSQEESGEVIIKKRKRIIVDSDDDDDGTVISNSRRGMLLKSGGGTEISINGNGQKLKSKGVQISNLFGSDY